MAANKSGGEARDAHTEEQTKRKGGGSTKTKRAAARLTQDDLIREYLEVYRRCMADDPKSFGAKGALSALDQISKLLGLDVPIKAADVEGDRVILTLSEKVGARGD